MMSAFSLVNTAVITMSMKFVMACSRVKVDMLVTPFRIARNTTHPDRQDRGRQGVGCPNEGWACPMISETFTGVRAMFRVRWCKNWTAGLEQRAPDLYTDQLRVT
jgi:hypothetical protein